MKLGWNKDTPKMMAAMPQLERYLIDKEFDILMEKVPDKITWSAAVIKAGGYKMWCNGPSPDNPPDIPDGEGDCTIATCAGEIATKSANAGSHMLVVPAALVHKEYRGLTGGVDSGLMMDQVMKAGIKPGYFQGDDKYSDKLVTWATFDPTNNDLARFCKYYFGGVRWGIDLPETAGWQIKNGRAWDYIANPTAAQGSNEAGSWGGHSCHDPDADTFGGTLITWMMKQPWTKAFQKNYFSFGGVTIDLNWFNAMHKTPITAISLKDLAADMKKWLQNQFDPNDERPHGN